MAGTITCEQLRELAAFRAGHGCAVSLSASLDPTTGDLASRTRSLLTRAARQLDGQSATLSHDERQALARDLERIGDWFDGERASPNNSPLRRSFGSSDAATGLSSRSSDASAATSIGSVSAS